MKISKKIQEKFNMKDYFKYYEDALFWLKRNNPLSIWNFSWCQREYGKVLEGMMELKWKEYIKLRNKLDKLNDKLIEKFIKFYT